MSDQSASIRLSTEHKDRRRREPVWIGRYRIVGKDSAKVLGKAWTKRSQAPDTELSPLWGRRKISSVTREEIAAYRTRLAARDLAPSTLNQTRAIVRGVFASAVERFEYTPDEQDAALFLTAAFTGLRASELRDLRHSFGTIAVRQFPITDVQTWMGHADIATTRKYIHYAQPEAAAKLGALVGEQLASVPKLHRVG